MPHLFTPVDGVPYAKDISCRYCLMHVQPHSQGPGSGVHIPNAVLMAVTLLF